MGSQKKRKNAYEFVELSRGARFPNQTSYFLIGEVSNWSTTRIDKGCGVICLVECHFVHLVFNRREATYPLVYNCIAKWRSCA